MDSEIYHKAIELLARREHSVVELRRKLLQRQFPIVQIDSALARLVEQKLLCDSRYTEMYIRARANRGMGPQRIVAELIQNGVSSDIITAQMAASKVDWSVLIRQVYAKKFRGKIAADYQSRAKIMRFLLYRGFTKEQIEHIFNNSINE